MTTCTVFTWHSLVPVVYVLGCIAVISMAFLLGALYEFKRQHHDPKHR